MLSAHAIVLTLTHRPARDDFAESWVCRLLLDDDSVLEAAVTSLQVAEVLGKLPRRSPVNVRLSQRDAKSYLAVRLTLEAVEKAAA